MAHETETLSTEVFSRVLDELERGILVGEPYAILKKKIDDLEATLPEFVRRLRTMHSLRITTPVIDLVRDIWYYRFV